MFAKRENDDDRKSYFQPVQFLRSIFFKSSNSNNTLSTIPPFTKIELYKESINSQKKGEKNAQMYPELFPSIDEDYQFEKFKRVNSSHLTYTNHTTNSIIYFNYIKMEKEIELKGHRLPISVYIMIKEARKNEIPKNKVISGSFDKLIKKWDMETGECEYTIDIHQSGIKFLVGLDSDRFLSCAGQLEREFYIWNIQDGKKLGKCLRSEVDESILFIKVFSPKRIFFITHSTIFLYRSKKDGISDYKFIKSRNIPPHQKITEVKCLKEKNMIVVGTDKGDIHFFNKKLDLLASLKSPINNDFRIRNITLLDDTHIIFVYKLFIMIYDIEKKRITVKRRLKYPTHEIIWLKELLTIVATNGNSMMFYNISPSFDSIKRIGREVRVHTKKIKTMLNLSDTMFLTHSDDNCFIFWNHQNVIESMKTNYSMSFMCL